ASRRHSVDPSAAVDGKTDRAQDLVQELNDFALKGNLVEIAVGLVLALAFTTVVASLVDDVIMQIVATIFGHPNFSGVTNEIGDASIRYGSLLNAVIVFGFIALALFLFVVRPHTVLKARQESGEGEAPAPPETSRCCGRSATR
ncbi:MAG: large conductance mechanosensitive channel protein MscL, partial [Acidimicrobiia bacterium]